MKSPLSLLGRGLFLLFVVILLAIGGVLAWFTSWRADFQAALYEESEVIETSRGLVECRVRGEGPAVLVLHDAPGGYDQAVVLASGLVEAGFKVIAPSRPGYLRTPLVSGLFPEEQADLMVALMDKLEIPTASVIGVGSGGGAAVFFALRHPDRISRLVLLSAVTRSLPVKWSPGESSQAPVRILHGLTGDIGAWIALELSHRDPRRILDAVLDWSDNGDEAARRRVADAVLADPSQLEWFQSLVASWNPLSPREVGARNDITNDMNLPKLAFDKITTPTLIIHGDRDKNVPVADVVATSTAIPGARFISVDGAGHWVFLGPSAPQAHQAISAFLAPPATP